MNITSKVLFVMTLVVALSPWHFSAICTAQSEVIYVAKVDGSVKFSNYAWPDKTRGITGDLEDALFAAGQSGTLVISGGVSEEIYTDIDIDSSDYRLDVQANDQTVRGALPSDDPSGVHSGTVILVSTFNHVVYNPDRTGFLIQNLKISGGALPPPLKYGIFDAGQTNTEDVTIDGTDRGLLIEGNHDVVHERLVVTNCLNTSEASIRLDGDGIYNFHYCVIEGNQSLYAIHGVQGTTNIYNCLLMGNKSYAVLTTGINPVINIKNSIFSANIIGLADVDLMRHNAIYGGIYVSTSLLLPHPTNRSLFLQDVTLSSPDDNLYNVPQFREGRRPAILVLGVDDNNHTDYWKALADECAARGFRAVYFMNSGGFNRWNELQPYVDAGHEVSSHTRWHSDMTSFNGIRIEYIGDGQACTLTIADNILSTKVYGGSGTENLNIDLTKSSKSLSGLASYINGLSGYACSWDDPMAGSGTRSKCLADVSNQNIKTYPYTCLIDANKLYDEELSNSKSDIENNLENYVCKSFAPPGNRTNEALQDALKARNYLGARGGFSAPTYLLEDIHVYDIKQHLPGLLLGSNYAQIQRRAAAFFEYLNHVGGIYVLYAHAEYDFSIPQWQVLLDVLAKSNVTVMTFSEAIEHIRNLRTGFLPAGTDEDGDGERWTRTLPNQADYRLKSNSACIDAGEDLGLAHDFVRSPVPYGIAPDMGIFESPWESPLPIGNLDYCRDFGPCAEGEGDCDNDGECQSGLICEQVIGTDTCQAAAPVCPHPVGHLDYCQDCGPCAEGQGDCDNDGECQSGLICEQVTGTDTCQVSAPVCPYPVGHLDYCRDCGPCVEGEGDCDNDSECQNGLTCEQVPGTDTCQSSKPVCPHPIGHLDYCRDCGPCDVGQGDCDNDGECLSGLSCVQIPGTDVCCLHPVGHLDYCRDCGPCGTGQGDCDNDGECQSGLTCVQIPGTDTCQ